MVRQPQYKSTATVAKRRGAVGFDWTITLLPPVCIAAIKLEQHLADCQSAAG
jgi:hypothetical protein